MPLLLLLLLFIVSLLCVACATSARRTPHRRYAFPRAFIGRQVVAVAGIQYYVWHLGLQPRGTGDMKQLLKHTTCASGTQCACDSGPRVDVILTRRNGRQRCLSRHFFLLSPFLHDTNAGAFSCELVLPVYVGTSTQKGHSSVDAPACHRFRFALIMCVMLVRIAKFLQGFQNKQILGWAARPEFEMLSCFAQK